MNIKGKILSVVALAIFFSPPGMAAQEVLNGSYICEGSVESFPTSTGIISLRVELGATSGITSNLRPTGRRLRGLPENLDALSEICNSHIDQVLTLIPQICAVGPISTGSQFGGGFGVGRSFDFSCKSGRNNIMDAISVVSRIPLSASIP